MCPVPLRDAEGIRRDSALAELLWEVSKFVFSRDDHGEPVRLSSGLALEGVADDLTGGAFFLCGDDRTDRPCCTPALRDRPVWLARSLGEALEITAGLPSWSDCPKFSGAGDISVMRTATVPLGLDELRDNPVTGPSPGPSSEHRS
ncbi:hypothetical protein GCM10015535_35240 [Streptomyces gelaticus]|uniref:Uncharacterized protein n=1 Tax=Streptomyces gelaticus TaxID=285446 RepID=A0ABQ2W1J0_9ACTN|nr:hypothetical protein GCM10015535_35240 [Streptomyces gelaticus]